MNVIPVANCPDAACAGAKAAVLAKFLPPGSFVHIDITDGMFSAHPTWNDPAGWARILAAYLLEVHLMTYDPADHMDNWLTAGARRIIVHAETVTPEDVRVLLDLVEAHHAELMVSTGPGTDVETAVGPIIHRFGAERFAGFQVLSVPPGAAGQPFGSEAVNRVAFLRAMVPHGIIEVDGGMNPETARLVKHAGADTIVSASDLFNAADPKEAYEELMRI